MNIVVERKKSGSFLAIFLFITLLIGVSAYGATAHVPREGWFAIGAAGIALLGLFVSLSNETPVLVINDTGIYDERLGVGQIMWRDVEDVHIEVNYGTRFLCFRMRHPEPYLNRLTGARREKALYNRKLGFQRFNIDVRQVEVSLLDLKKQIENCIERQRT